MPVEGRESGFREIEKVGLAVEGAGTAVIGYLGEPAALDTLASAYAETGSRAVALAMGAKRRRLSVRYSTKRISPNRSGA